MNGFARKALLSCLTFLSAACVNSLNAAYFEGFDNVGNITVNSDPLRWSWFNKSQNAGAAANDPSIGGWWQGVTTSTFNAFAGPANSYARADFGSSSLGNVFSNWFITPTFDFIAGDTFSFYTRTIANSAYPDRLQIRLSTSGTSNNVGADFNSVGVFTTMLGEINPNETAGVYPENWTQYTYAITNSFTGRIGFRYYVQNTNTNGNYIGLDSFSTTANLHTPVPEPSTYLLGSVASALLFYCRQKRNLRRVNA
jgi:hypothetical protein